nr:uncharacterized protein LOC109168478 [Ipomoea batatas]
MYSAVKIRIHHGGNFVQKPVMDYVDGEGAIDLYVEHGIDDAEVVQNLALPEPEHVDDIQEDVEVEDDPSVGTQEDNNPSVVSQAGNEQVQSSGLGFSDEEADLETIMKMEILIWKEVLKMKLILLRLSNAENNNEESRRARAKVDNENVGLGEKDDVQSAYYYCEDPLSYQFEKEEVNFNGDDGYEIKKGRQQFKVKLAGRSCSCRAWDLSGIPCPHAICVIFAIGREPHEYIDSCYSKESYLRTYAHALQPMNGEIF